MIERLIDICLRNRFLVIGAFVLILIWGVLSFRNTPIDAIPDIGDLQVIVYAEWTGRSPKDIEDQVLYPLTTKLMGTPGVKTIRSSSAFGFGMVNLIFREGVDFYWARTRVLERLNFATTDLPADAKVSLGPDVTAVGQIFWYTVENGYYCSDHPQESYAHPGHCPQDGKELVSSTYDLGELRSIQDWYVRYGLNAVSGVSEVASVGGYVRQYQIDIDPYRLAHYHITALEVINAVKRSNIDVGAKVFETGGVEFIIRGVGFIKKLEDIENIAIAAHEGVPVYVRDIGVVTIGPDFRRGALDRAGTEVTGGVVVMRHGQNPVRVIKGVKDKIEELSVGLPSGVRIVAFYDRTGLIGRVTNTLRDALLQEILITIFVIVVFLFHFFGGMIISAVLPLGVLISFILMRVFGIDANIMSLGGIAIAIGVMVDAGSVLVENIYRKVAERQKRSSLSKSERLELCVDGAKEVGRPVFFALLTTIIGFIPVFVLTGQAGRLFRPLAYTKTFAMVGAALIAVCLLPTLAYYLIRGRLRLPDENVVSRTLRRLYHPVIKWSLQHKRLVLLFFLIFLSVGLATSFFVKQEFMPPLNEGDLLFMPVLLPGASLTQVMEIMRKQDIIIKNDFAEEVEWVVGKLGRAETSTDPAPITMIETIIHLRPESQWRKGMTREKLINEIQSKTRIPGVSPIMTQPIRNRIDMLATGIQTPVGMKVFGPDLKVVEQIATELEAIVSAVKGAASVYAERIGNRPYFEIEINREQIARYGVNLGTVQDIIAMAIGGMNITHTVEGRERYPVRVRYMRDFRDSPESLADLLIPTPSGAHVPMGLLVNFRKTLGPAMIQSENTVPYFRVFINVDQDLVGLVDFVRDAQRAVEDKIASGDLEIPPGYYMSWSGQFESEVEARNRLAVVLPICLAVILLLLYMAFKDVSSVFIVALGLPFALVGGVIPLFLLGFKFSTAVWVGFIALFGVATDNAVVLMAVFRNIFEGKRPLNREEVRGMVIEGGLLRVRPILMTVLTTVLALMPIMFFTSAGAEVIKPMASPIIGGLMSATFANLILVPVLYSWIKERRVAQ
ncbi:MAG: CusA/CzcA family heavy metal efflux RND transporter [candidate division WOR-3 bacterium]|nr:CusA/CzcA family heavy metal efflux RND transporter [candidate division WOR-3 bacterium]